MHKLEKNFLEALSQGLQRKTYDKCSRWAKNCRVMGGSYPGPWSFKHFPWLKDMHDADDPECVGQKAAQLGYTEVGINRTFYMVDIRKIDCLYILPTKTPDASDFSSSRFDGALESSIYLNDLFTDVKNVGHKRSGSINLYIRGSRSRAGLKLIPAGLIIIDELDEMIQENIPLALERQSGQIYKQVWYISTPTVDGYGVNVYFLKSTQEEFFFKCPCCSRSTRLIFPECLVITSDDPDNPKIKDTYIVCKECKNRLPHETKYEWLESGIWVPKHDNKMLRGFHINQLYSPTVEPYKLAISYLRAQTNPADEQEFYNSKLGLPHIAKDSKVTDQDILNCMGNYTNGLVTGGFITIGIDQGKWLHYVVQEWTQKDLILAPDINMASLGKILKIGKCLHFGELEILLNTYRPIMTVIDSQPERRLAYEFAQKYWGFIKLCYYGTNIASKQINEGKDDMEQCVTVDRTSWLDLSLGRIRNQTTKLPLDTPFEFRNHVKSLVRVPGKDKFNNPTNTYLNTAADHYGHALNYSEIALALTAGMGQSQSIASPR